LGSSGRVPDPLGRAHALLEAALTHRQGLIFLTGPARSGLSTSLAAWAGLLDCERAHVAHWADDGLSLPGCTPVRNATLTELIDLDLDVLLLDKKRDFGPEQLREVARLAQRALVICVWPGWSDVCEFLLRCKEIGLVTSHIRTVVNQRLIRLLCPDCKQTCLLDHPLIKEGTSGFKAGGCPECDHVGYRGQLPLFEVVEVGGELRDLLLRQTTLVRLRQTTFIEALFRDGLEQVKAGLTSLEEAERVLGPAPPELTLD
jgi:hypothetical protein